MNDSPRRKGVVQAGSVRSTRAKGESSAKRGSNKKRGERPRGTFTLGRASFAQISAVEGIRLSHEMERDFREFDRKGFSAEERRRAIMSKYGRKPA